MNYSPAAQQIQINVEPPLTSAIQCKIFPLDAWLEMLKPSRMFSAVISAGPACGGGGVKTRWPMKGRREEWSSIFRYCPVIILSHKLVFLRTGKPFHIWGDNQKVFPKIFLLCLSVSLRFIKEVQRGMFLYIWNSVLVGWLCGFWTPVWLNGDEMGL